MKLRNPFQRHTATKYIQVNTRFCEACWSCLDACSNDVLGKIEFGPHRHVRIDRAENCKGCKKCVNACSLYGFWLYQYVHGDAAKFDLCQHVVASKHPNSSSKLHIDQYGAE